MKRTQTQLVVFTSLFFCLAAGIAQAQPQWCNPNQLRTVADLEKTHRVIDARPSEVDKVTGRNAFKKRAQVAIINMNPFLFKYDVKVEQSLIEDRAQLDFLKLLGAPISDLAGIASFRAVATSQDAEELKAGGDLERLEALTGGPPPAVPPPPPPPAPVPPPPHLPPPPPAATCSVSDTVTATQALNYLSDVRDRMLRLKTEIEKDLVAMTAAYQPARGAYLSVKDVLYSPTSDSVHICTASENLMTAFTNPANPPYPTRADLNALKRKIADLDKLIEELKSSATAFSTDKTYEQCQARLNGFDYASSLVRLATAMEEYQAALGKRAQVMTDETKAYDFLEKTIRSFAGPGGAGQGPGMRLLQNIFDITGQFDVTQLDIELIPTALQPLKPFNDPDEIDAFRMEAQAAREPLGSSRRSSRQIRGVEVTTVGDVGDGGGAQASRVFIAGAPARLRSGRINAFAETEPAEGDGKPDEPNHTKANATIGARRFELSGGMAFSTLNRREFQSVLGFPRNANGQIVDKDGNPTDKRELSTIVGISESSKSRFSPIVLLNTRLTDNPKYNLFFSVGVTAKNDSKGTDIEYLIGPSFNFLNKNAFFTFGAYAGKQQKLAGDLFEGAPLSDTSVPVEKKYKWAPAFSFTYRIPIGSKPNQ